MLHITSSLGNLGKRRRIPDDEVHLGVHFSPLPEKGPPPAREPFPARVLPPPPSLLLSCLACSKPPLRTRGGRQPRPSLRTLTAAASPAAASPILAPNRRQQES